MAKGKSNPKTVEGVKKVTKHMRHEMEQAEAAEAALAAKAAARVPPSFTRPRSPSPLEFAIVSINSAWQQNTCMILVVLKCFYTLRLSLGGTRLVTSLS